MKVPIRTLSAQDAEIRARTTVTRTVGSGRVECHGLHWYSHALKTWEQKQKEFGRSRRVEIRVDELNLGVVYVEVPDQGYGPIKADSTQPTFTENLSLYELKKLKAVLKSKHIASRIGRLADSAALALRIEHYEALDHKDDPVAMRRLSENRAQMHEQQIKLNQKCQTENTGDGPPAEPGPAPEPRRPSSDPPAPPAEEADGGSSSPPKPPGRDKGKKQSEMTASPPRKMKSLQIKRKPI